MAAAAGPKANLRLLDEMIAARKEMAELGGCSSYSQYKARDASLAQVSGFVMVVAEAGGWFSPATAGKEKMT